MGLFGLSKKQKYLLDWQKIIMLDLPNKLIMTEKQLQQASNQQASDDLRIIQDCIKILSNTTKPETFFSRLDLLKEKAKHLKLLEPYIKYIGASPTAAFDEVISNEQEAIHDFITRYCCTAFEKCEKLKTEKGKINQLRKLYDSLQPYFDRMNQNNIDYIKKQCQDIL